MPHLLRDRYSDSVCVDLHKECSLRTTCILGMHGHLPVYRGISHMDSLLHRVRGPYARLHPRRGCRLWRLLRCLRGWDALTDEPCW